MSSTKEIIEDINWIIPDGWSFAWSEKEKCLKCGGSLITIRQGCGEMNQYEVRCSKCGSLVSEHYEP